MIKENDKFRSDYAAMNLHDYDLTTRAEEAGREKGLEEGALKKAIEAAKNLLRMKLGTHEQIAHIQRRKRRSFLYSKHTASGGDNR